MNLCSDFRCVNSFIKPHCTHFNYTFVMKKAILITILMALSIGHGYSQDNTYYTQSAILLIHGKYGDQALVGLTKELRVSLDYETTEMILKFNSNTLAFNVDTLNHMLETTHQEVTFSGALDLDYINTKGHPPLDFAIEGRLSIEQSTVNMNGKGELHHITDAGIYSCLLGITMKLNLNDLQLELPSQVYHEIEIEITQALLERDKN